MTAESPPVDEAFAERRGWLTPEDLAHVEALADAEKRLRDAGYKVTRNPSGRTIEAELTVGSRRAVVSLVEGAYWLIELYRTNEGGVAAVGEEWPDTVADAVARAVELAGEMAEAHDADQEPPAIGDELAEKAKADAA